MKTAARKKRAQDTGEDLWAWAERRETPVIREDPPAQPGWYRGLIKKISGQKDEA